MDVLDRREPAQTESAPVASTVRCRFAGRPEAVAAARRFVREALGERASRVFVDLMVSELATNAVLHAGTAFEVGVRVDGDVIRVEVADGSGVTPRPPRATRPDAEHGRGLRLVEGLARCWGYRPTRGGKVIWFEV
jgi:anti-sigma regulatory factor (Ser/Thr protein kinase)